jgi:hypothetical protein
VRAATSMDPSVIGGDKFGGGQSSFHFVSYHEIQTNFETNPPLFHPVPESGFAGPLTIAHHGGPSRIRLLLTSPTSDFQIFDIHTICTALGPPSRPAIVGPLWELSVKVPGTATRMIRMLNLFPTKQNNILSLGVSNFSTCYNSLTDGRKRAQLVAFSKSDPALSRFLQFF